MSAAADAVDRVVDHLRDKFAMPEEAAGLAKEAADVFRGSMATAALALAKAGAEPLLALAGRDLSEDAFWAELQRAAASAEWSDLRSLLGGDVGWMATAAPTPEDKRELHALFTELALALAE